MTLKHFKSCKCVNNDDFQRNISREVLSDPMTHCATGPFWCHQGFPEWHREESGVLGPEEHEVCGSGEQMETAATLRLQTTFGEKRP